MSETQAAAGRIGAAPQMAAPRPRRWPLALIATLIVLAAYAAIGVHGARQEAAEARILGSLTPIFEWLRDNGDAARRWMQINRVAVGAVGTAALAAIGLAALLATRRRSAPVLLLIAIFACATWAQVALQSDRTGLGIALYLAAFGGAVGLGIWCPLRDLPGWPLFPPPRPGEPAGPAVGLGWPMECALVLGLTLLALISRTWALTELYDFFDLETIDWIVQGRTWHGYKGYLDFGFVQNNGGAVQFLPTQVILRLFGTSIFTLRLTSVLWSITAMPLMYGLGRRIGGVTAGTIAAVLLLTAPEQLFWARNENLHFAPIAICALITAHLCLWLVQRLSLGAVLVTALWMPWCRWFYSASVVAFLIPIATAAHAMLFGRRLWRRAWIVLPGLALGLLFWLFSLTAMRAALHEGQWRFVDPSTFYGASAWRKQGEFRDASTTDLIALQVVSLGRNFGAVLRDMSYATPNFSHWCQRSQPADYKTILNVGVTLLLFVGLGYLLGQCTDRRAFLLLAFWGISTLPAILSQDPADRRMAMMFPAAHVLVGVTLAAFLRIVSQRGGRLADTLAYVTAAVGLGVIGLTNLASHLMLPIQPVLFSDYPRFTKPMFERGDAIFTNMPGPFRTLSLFGNLDRFLEAPTCVQAVEPHGWLDAALDPTCRYDDGIYNLTLPPQRVEALRQGPPPQRYTYILTDEPASAPYLAMLRALHPQTPIERQVVPRAERALNYLTVDAEQVAALRSPSLTGPPGVPNPLQGVPLTRSPSAGPGVNVEGGLLVEGDGWYRWRLDPPCPSAALLLDGVAVSPQQTRPLLAGVHPFTLAMPEPGACTLPLRITSERLPGDGGPVPLSPQRFTSLAVAALPELRAASVTAIDGYAAPQKLLQLGGRPVDFGVDAAGNITVLLQEQSVWKVKHFDPSGTLLAEWPIETPLNYNLNALAVAPDGTIAVPVQNRVILFAPDGKQVGGFLHNWIVWESHFAFWGNDLLLTNIHHRDTVVAYDRQGKVVGELTSFGDPQGKLDAPKLYAPMTIALSPDGDLLVQQLDGWALRFKLDGPGFAPRFVSRFRADTNAGGAAFAPGDRILVPTEQGVRTYDGSGQRLLAADAARDLSQQPIGRALRLQRVGDRLYLLDSDKGTLWTIAG